MVNPGVEVRSCRIATTQPGCNKSHIISLFFRGYAHLEAVVEQSIRDQFPWPDVCRDKKCYGADKIHKVR
jgi:hypothetical protein